MDGTIGNSLRVLGLVAAFAGVGNPLGAQEVPPAAPDRGRAGSVLVIKGGALDVEASVDTRLFVDRFRVRASVGHGRWVDANERLQNVSMTRVGVTALFFKRPRAESVWTYGGVGYATFLPHGGVVGRYHGLHLVSGIEGRAGEWAVGPELAIELGLPTRRPWSSEHPMMCGTTRFGIAIRRRF